MTAYDDDATAVCPKCGETFDVHAVVSPNCDGELPATNEQGLPWRASTGSVWPRAEFITGRAGTGKTFLMRQRAEEHSGVVLCATTGIAAVNLGEGITTINSLLGYFDTASLRDLWTTGFLGTKLRRLYHAGVTRLVLDEVSMMDGEQLTILDAAIQEMNEHLGLEEGEAFGLTLTGDFCQLPPVKAPFAFEMECWDEYRAHTQVLTKIWRQTELDFIEGLGYARKGDGRKALDYFGPRLQEGLDHNFEGVTLLSKNAEVDRFNLLRMSKLKGELHTWKSIREGKQRGEWKLIPDTLTLKEGCLVMVLANEKLRDEHGKATSDYRYVNGDLGTLEGGLVRLKRNDRAELVQPVTRHNLVPLEPGRRKELREAGEAWKIVCSRPQCLECERGLGKCPNAKYERVGSITYMPLRLAWATTVHKSQGLSMDLVQVDFRDHFYTSPAMLYVALSRARTGAGLRIVGRPQTFVARCNTNKRLREWV